jgi:hypothetical protein
MCIRAVHVMPAILREMINMAMKEFIFTAVFLGLAVLLPAQDGFDWKQGTVTFVSSRNVYVKFTSTELITAGDTLFQKEGDDNLPVLVVENKSSTSAVCSAIGGKVFQIGATVFARVKHISVPVSAKPDGVKPAPAGEVIQPSVPIAPIVTPEEDSVAQLTYKERINARFSVASYSNFSDFGNMHRTRYGLNFTGQHLGGSKFSLDSYIIFRQTLGAQGAEPAPFADALKIYGLSLKYDLNSGTSLMLGRRINPRMSSVGAMDGIQAEKIFGRMMVGAIVGSRPNFTDYAIDFSLMQMGGFIGWNSKPGQRMHQSTIGFLEQMNHFRTDRRFVYFQHSSQPVKPLTLFGSLEADFFEQIRDVKNNNIRLTNIFASARLKVTKKLQIQASFDSRRNIIYYESYKNFIDQYIDDETRQGLRLGFNYNPFRFVTLGVNSSWRFQQSGANATTNYNGYLNLAKIGSLKIRTSLTANLLETGYLKSKIFGARLSHQLIRNKLDAEAYYRRIQYQFINSGKATDQNVFGASLSVNVVKSLNVFLFYEGILGEPAQTLHRINTRLMYRF